MSGKGSKEAQRRAHQAWLAAQRADPEKWAALKEKQRQAARAYREKKKAEMGTEAWRKKQTQDRMKLYYGPVGERDRARHAAYLRQQRQRDHEQKVATIQQELDERRRQGEVWLIPPGRMKQAREKATPLPKPVRQRRKYEETAARNVATRPFRVMKNGVVMGSSYSYAAALHLAESIGGTVER